MGKISFTMDMWTDNFNRKPYMAVTAHWLEKAALQTSRQPKISLRTDLIGFMHVPGSHTGQHLAEAFLFIINPLKIAKKVFFSILTELELILFYRLGGLPWTMHQITTLLCLNCKSFLFLMAFSFLALNSVFGMIYIFYILFG